MAVVAIEPTHATAADAARGHFRCEHVDDAGRRCDDVRPSRHGAWMHFQRTHVSNWSTKPMPIPGALNPGERELVRRRLLYTIGEISLDLGRTPKAVIDAAIAVAILRFERSARRGPL